MQIKKIADNKLAFCFRFYLSVNKNPYSPNT